MRGTLLGAILMITAATMMGCGDTIMPCTTADDCVLDFDLGWDSQADARDDWGDWGDWGGEIVMVCNTGVTALDKCNELVGWMQGFMDSDWLPIPDIGELDICGWMFDGEDAPGTCEMEWGI